MRFAQDLTRFVCRRSASIKRNLEKTKNQNLLRSTGAHDRNRTGDLVLTKDVLYRLSYVGKILYTRRSTNALHRSTKPEHRTESSTQAGAGSGNRTHVISLEG